MASSGLRAVLLWAFSHRFLALARWEWHFLGIRVRNALSGQRRRIGRFLATRQSPLFLNLGSGPRGLDDGHWVNVDGYADRNVHFLLDFTRPLPFPDASFDGVFCEHVLEHFSLDDGERLSREVCRVLRRGGSLRVVVPDGELLMRRYFDAPAEMLARRDDSGSGTTMEVVNSYFRQRYEHQFMYDWITLERMLSRAGFVKTIRTACGQATTHQPLVLDDRKYEWESLYVEAVK